ncbi:Formamidopyrimidine-DNA glycolase [gamma proteobacterium HdN1]|nr:Formamidopyrimidine-DNA glycolase [gamma proteobacterium HdN1]
MPELPEVETTRRGILPHIQGLRVQQVIVRQPKLRWPVSPELVQLAGEPLRDIARRGKYLLFSFDRGIVLAHLGMSGSLRILESEKPADAHDHLDWVFENGITLRYHDPRRFGAWLWWDGESTGHPLLESLGPEPLEPDFTAQYLYRTSRGRKVPVKSFVMNSHVVVGVGNIYANEALFSAGISPLRAAGRISLERYQRLVESIRKILEDSIRQGGTTLRDFVGGDGKPGYFQQTLQVYGRAGAPCLKCGESLCEIRLGQRTTVFCKVCQT